MKERKKKTNDSKNIKNSKFKKKKSSQIQEETMEQRKGFNSIEVSCIIVISVLFGVIMGCVLMYGRNRYSSFMSSEVREFVSTYENILDNYYDSVDKKELMNAAIAGMISSLDDPYSSYMDDATTDEFNQTVEGSYVGIGATVSWEEEKSTIISLFSNSPGEKAGLKVGDIIKKIDKKEVQGLSLDEISKLMKGNIGTKVNITVLRGTKEKTFTVKRSRVEIPSVSSKVISKDDKKVGYLFIETFSSNTYSQFEQHLKHLEKKKISSLIIDVRDNPGGQLLQVKRVLDVFFDKDTVLYQIETKGKKQKIKSSTKDKKNYPIVVLVNSASASASEILASCFQENYKNASIVGVTTYGKGTVQKAIELSSGASLKYTTQKWLTSKGKWINEKGVIPDVEVVQEQNSSEVLTDENDMQLQKALEILTQSKKESN